VTVQFDALHSETTFRLSLAGGQKNAARKARAWKEREMFVGIMFLLKKFTLSF